MQVEQHNQHQLSHPYPLLPPYFATEDLAATHIGQLPLPLPTVVQPSKVVENMDVTFPRCPHEIICLLCQQQVMTKTEHRISSSTWCMCCVVFFVGGFLGCCFLPFFMKSCKDVVHRCPKCNSIIGRKPLI